MTPISGKKRLQKPRTIGVDARKKLLYIDAADLRLIERAAKSLTPPPSSSYFMVQAAVERARTVLNLPA
jgi:uncharacterized protein (DUF1778 family)